MTQPQKWDGCQQPAGVFPFFSPDSPENNHCDQPQKWMNRTTKQHKNGRSSNGLWKVFNLQSSARQNNKNNHNQTPAHYALF